MRTETLVESKTSLIPLEICEVEALKAAGKRLSSDKTWWGREAPADRSVIRCDPGPEGLWRVRVVDAVGVVATESVQLVVKPKIPTQHLLYLLSKSGHFPRLDETRASVPESRDLWDLVASWFVTSSEAVLRRDLVKDYSPSSGFLLSKRGHIDAIRTARAFYSGQFGFDCSYDDFNTNTPLNRVLKTAARAVLRHSHLEPDLRRRASRVVDRMKDVGDIRPSDFRALLDRRTHHYRDALLLARQVLRWAGRFIGHGGDLAWTFLIRTPEMVEEGLRRILKEEFGQEWKVEKRGVRLEGSKLTLNPDLVFGDGWAVADVKYKLFGTDWIRSDLYQIVAFASAYQTPHCAVVGFTPPGVQPLPRLRVGNVEVESITWETDARLSPQEAARKISSSILRWLKGTTEACA